MGDLWPMKSANDKRVLLFVPDMCRYETLNPNIWDTKLKNIRYTNVSDLPVRLTS